MKATALAFAMVVVIAFAVYVASLVSPWPKALLVRYLFEKDAVQTDQALAKHVPPGIAELRNQRYDAADGDALLDVYFPKEVEASGRALPTIVWVHGGGWLSGSKDHIANYSRILASHGYTAVSVDYSVAPRARYPTPLRQLAKALAYLQQGAGRLHIDPTKIFFAGDSGGAHIVAQMANIISVPSYAGAVGVEPTLERTHLAGVLLYCGPYDIMHANLQGAFGGFIRTLLWSYSGTKDFLNDRHFKTMSVMSYVSGDFPPAFISGGNGDPLTAQSRAMAETLSRLGVPVDTLFFEDGYEPPQPHEYQFDLDGEAGQLALRRSLVFLAKYTQTGSGSIPPNEGN